MCPWIGRSQKGTGTAGFNARDSFTKVLFSLSQLCRSPSAPAWGQQGLSEQFW